MHVNRYYRHGDPLLGAKTVILPGDLCSVEGCDRLVEARGLCKICWSRWYRNGDPTVYLKKMERLSICSIEGCENEGPTNRGWCSMHYSRWQRNGDPLVVQRLRRKNLHPFVPGDIQIWCISCEKWKDFEDFDAAPRNTSARTTVCKRCRRSDALRKKFGIDADEWDTMFAEQGFRCANSGCKADHPSGSGWHLDHDRACCPGDVSCGKCIRGILCARCNMGLGHFYDDVDRLLGIISYLTSAREYDTLVI